MTRRDFIRCVGYAIAAIVAGKPIAAAWLAALERQRRREMILAQMTYQAQQAMRAYGRKLALQTYGDPHTIAWSGEPYEWDQFDDVGFITLHPART